MNETQWPRFQVFQQESADKPHTNAGTVHAPDREMALQNARDVFVRRPDCHSLWVTPAEQIHSLTAEELEAGSGVEGPVGVETDYAMFVKRRQVGSHEHAGSVKAPGPEAALQIAAQSHEGLVWWVVPADQITMSDPTDIESMFDPAHAKPYRHQSDYPTVTLMRKVRGQSR